ncbi:hypothetical protein GCM10011512_00450 [Tersicoccus solisilvae]|uniref:MFS transporter n=1 Tax=Tersicoccus solisilvae TaxID=1882339 RepID=A0ABQ1NLI1_9MICC|nr:hypothetical protein [Tersicoccus solisilvae]GGC77810.1 hypothetical protein GCM10011512_00450 [Tersicoccus solisilvae]
MTPTRLRLPRAAAVTTAMVALGLGAHTTAGGPLPPVPILVAVTVVALVPTMLLAGRKLTTGVLGCLLVAGQAVLHLVFTRLSLPGTTPTTSFLIGHGHHGGEAAPPLAPGAAASAVSASPSVPMLVLHALATLGVAVVLARGEAALLTLLGWLRPLLHLPAPTRLPVPPRSVSGTATPAPPARTALRLPRRRGPPPAPAR